LVSAATIAWHVRSNSHCPTRAGLGLAATVGSGFVGATRAALKVGIGDASGTADDPSAGERAHPATIAVRSNRPSRRKWRTSGE
jgi:hypothetical protein